MGGRGHPHPYRAWLGADGGPGGSERPLPPNIPPGGRVHMASPRLAGPPPNGGQVWPSSRPVSRPDRPESRVRGQRPAEPLVCSSLPPQSLQLIHGDRQVGDRRQAPGGRRAEKRLHDGRRRGRGAAGEEQAAAVRGLGAQFHGRARPPRAPLPLPPPLPTGQTQTRPAVPGRRCRGGSGADARCFPSPREASGRAGAGNLKIKSKQTRRVEEGERPEPRGSSPASHAPRFPLTALPSPGAPRTQRTFTCLPGCRCEEGLSR